MTGAGPKTDDAATGMSVMTVKFGHGVQPGDRIRLPGDTNKTRRVVAGIRKTESDTSFRLLTFTRPSRGYARHVRRKKQERGLAGEAGLEPAIRGFGDRCFSR